MDNSKKYQTITISQQVTTYFLTSMARRRSYTKLLFVGMLIVTGILLTLTIQAQFITKWKITDGNEVITIPTTGPGYNYNVNWGDGHSSTATGNISHTYKDPGIYTVSITGTFPRIYFDGTGSKDKIIEISQWGANTWESMNGAFRGCINMNITATDVPVLSGVPICRICFMNVKNLIQPALLLPPLITGIQTG